MESIFPTIVKLKVLTENKAKVQTKQIEFKLPQIGKLGIQNSQVSTNNNATTNNNASLNSSIQRSSKTSSVQNIIDPELPNTSMVSCETPIYALNINSCNCAFILFKNYFMKVRISDNSDPLINEVIYTKILNKYDTDLFVKYINHGIISGNCFSDINFSRYKFNIENLNPDIQYQFLVTSIISNPLTLYDCITPINGHYPSIMLALPIDEVNTMLDKYAKIAKPIGFMHNDLHLDNILFDKDHFKIIDFGRCFVNDEELNKYDGLLSDFSKYYTIGNIRGIKNITHYSFDNDLRLTNSPNYEFGYLSDIAALSLNFLIRLQKSYLFPKWCKLDTNLNVINFNKATISKKEIDEIKNDPFKWLYIGLLWFTCYVNFVNLEQYKIDKYFVFNKDTIKDLVMCNYTFLPKIYETDACKKYLNNCYTNLQYLFDPEFNQSGGAMNISDQNNIEKTDYNNIYELYLQDKENLSDKIIYPSLSDDYRLKHCLSYTSSLYQELNSKLKTLYKPSSRIVPSTKIVEPSGILSARRYPISTAVIDKVIPNNKVSAAAGSSKRIYKIIIDRINKRKYIRKSNKKWYLDENRGKYRYADVDHKTITI
jgi:hypothetical protein